MKYVFKKRVYTTIAFIIDVVGSVLFFVPRLLKKSLPADARKILIVRLDHIGDFVSTSPLFKNLKSKFPQAELIVLVNPSMKELAERDGHIDRVLVASSPWLERTSETFSLKGFFSVIKTIRREHCDIGIDPRGDMFSILIMFLGGVNYRVGYGITGGGFLLNKEAAYDATRHIIGRNLALLKELNIPVNDDAAEVYYNDDDKNFVEALLQKEPCGRGQNIILHPYAGAPAKEWPQEKFRYLICELRKSGWNIILIGSRNDTPAYADVCDMRGCLSLPQLAYLIKRIRFFIGLDSGPANMAAALGVPAIIICSGTNIPELWIPKSDKVTFVYRDVSCKPCAEKVCPKPIHECMKTLEASEVMEKLKIEDRG